MIRHTIKVLPTKRENLQLVSLFVNSEKCQDFTIYSKFASIKMQDYMHIYFKIINIDNYNNVSHNYPKLYTKIDLFDEKGQIYKKNFKILKEDSFIIEPPKINLEKIKLKIYLLQDEVIIDTAVIDIV